MVLAKRAENLLRKLIHANSENPTGNCKKVADIIKKEMAASGMEVRIHEFKKGIPNVVGILHGNPRGKTLLLTPHMDTVPAGSGWKYSPFSAKKIGNKIYGRGASDCKINVAACLEAARSIKESGRKLNGTLIIAVTGDEEAGSNYGLKPLLDRRILKPDFALVADNDNFNIVVAQKGLIHFKVSIYGRKAHGAYPWLGTNAIEIASRIICEMKKYKFACSKLPGFEPPTINIGTIKGGDKVNIVADFCEFQVDLRYLPGTKKHKIMAEMGDIIKRHANRYKISISDSQLPYECNKSDIPISILENAAKKFGKKANKKYISGATQISFFGKGNAIATGFGPENVAHMTNEFVYARDIEKGALELEDFILNYLGYDEKKPKTKNILS